MPDIHIGLVELSIVVVGTIFWFAKLETKERENSKQIELLWKKKESMDDSIKEVLHEFSIVRETLARIEGFLQMKSKD